MSKYKFIFLDGAIFLVTSVALVLGLDFAFSSLRSSTDTPNLINQAIIQSSKGEDFAQKCLWETQKASSQKEFIQKYTEKDEHGRTPLMIASYVNFKDPQKREKADTYRAQVAQLLLTGFQKPAFKDDKALLGKLSVSLPKSDVNAKDKDGWSALMWASWSGLPQTAQKLLQAGANKEIKDSKGNSALSIAQKLGHTELISLLSAENPQP